MSNELNRVKNELNRVKNDLISREALKKAFDTWDKFGYTAQGELIRLTEETKDLYVPYVKYQDIVNCIDNAPTVDLRLMKTEECAGHSIEYAMGWKACIEWLKQGGDTQYFDKENDNG